MNPSDNGETAFPVQMPTILVGEVRFFDYEIGVTNDKIFLQFSPYGMQYLKIVLPFDRLSFRKFVSTCEGIFDRESTDETEVPPAA